MFKLLTSITLLTLSLGALAEDFSGKGAMNDISFNDYKEFQEKWTLVTIRFRKDTGEMRLTYANDLAMKTMKEGSINYPDGAVIAKTGIATGADPQFISSVVPKGIRRYQLMVKNKTKYASTGGWGYGLFDPEGKTFAEDPKVTQDACYACHTIVENRGDVFSQPFSFTQNTKFILPPDHMGGNQMKYEWIKTNKLPALIAKYVPTGIKKIRTLTNSKLKMNLFQGTLDEMKPILEYEVRKNKAPAVFYSNDTKRFVLVFTRKSQECMELGSFEVISTDLNNNPITEKYCTND